MGVSGILRRMMAAAAVVCACGVAVPQAVAQPAPGELGSAGWQHSITPYLFLPLSTTGTSEIDGASAPVDLDLGQVLDHLEGAASVRYEGWKGRYGIVAEGYWTKLGADQTLPPGGAIAQGDVDSRQAFVTLQGAYRVGAGRTAAGRPFATDLAFGARWNRLTQEVTLTDTGGAQMLFGGAEEWFEPVVSGRYTVEVAEDWVLGVRADLAGFGVGGNDLSYLALVGMSWQKWENTSLRFGYQFFGIDFATERPTGRFAYDVDQNGAYVGLSFRF